MVREDILGGLKAALAKGQTLRQAMMSFYNAGYVKAEIEEAGKVLQAEIANPVQPQFPAQPEQEFSRSGSSEKPEKTVQKASAYGAPTQPIQQTMQPSVQPTQQSVQQILSQPVQIMQRISAYGKSQQPQVARPGGKAIIYILVTLLVILIGGLIALFFFKDKIMALFAT